MNNEKYVIEIRNSLFGYANQFELKVNQLLIPKQKTIFILGSSGIGKSTLIETLGLLKNTILNSNESEVFFNLNNNESINYNLIDQEDSYKIRSNSFSFLFQDDQLLNNYTVEENIKLSCIALDENVNKDIPKLFHDLNLDQNLLQKKITQLSGGQKKRIALVRSLYKPFEIIFCDEPTGNLDEFNSNSLFTLLKETVDRLKTTAVLVSHNINLALKFGDMIIPITRNKQFGEIKESSLLYNQDGWKFENEIECENPKSYLQSVLHN